MLWRGLSPTRRYQRYITQERDRPKAVRAVAGTAKHGQENKPTNNNTQTQTEGGPQQCGRHGAAAAGGGSTGAAGRTEFFQSFGAPLTTTTTTTTTTATATTTTTTATATATTTTAWFQDFLYWCDFVFLVRRRRGISFNLALIITTQPIPNAKHSKTWKYFSNLFVQCPTVHGLLVLFHSHNAGSALMPYIISCVATIFTARLRAILLVDCVGLKPSAARYVKSCIGCVCVYIYIYRERERERDRICIQARVCIHI